jgi:formylglycine-generating enzyme required for sulfatase activity
MRVKSGLQVAAVLLFSALAASAQDTGARSTMILVPAGAFTMGSPASEAARFEDEVGHEVRLSAYLIGKKEISVAVFRSFVAATGYATTAERERGAVVIGAASVETRADAYWDKPYFEQGEDSPVVDVSWFDALEYCNWRSLEEGLDPVYSIEGRNVSADFAANGYRLPTEAEWECACRAGTTTATAFGDTLSLMQANLRCSYPFDVHKFAVETSLMGTASEGSYPPNAWGISDMHGNVAEWCWDRYGPYAIPAGGGAEKDPVGALSGQFRVRRGGDWNGSDSNARSAARGSAIPDYAGPDIGFRIARNAL